ncbi:MAG: ribose 5-phosphate isomerase B [Bacteroidetes bacterium]|jgi:ribose 5-phosphate isomerase B|nr:ribose 5-phosphate isomerase B [Bacteroidota bacterium]
MTIALGCDHAGFPLKSVIQSLLNERGLDILDFGTHSDSSVDYPDFVHPAAEAVENGKAAAGILLCGSGNGVAMTANKHQDIRAALCWNAEIATLARAHNNANMIALPVRYITASEAKDIVTAFLDTPFEGGRHLLRINKIPC